MTKLYRLTTIAGSAAFLFRGEVCISAAPVFHRFLVERRSLTYIRDWAEANKFEFEEVPHYEDSFDSDLSRLLGV